MRKGTPRNNKNSLVDKSTGKRKVSALEKPNSAFIQDLKKKVGPNKYKNTNKNTAKTGKRSMKKEKNKNSETKKIEPGNPKKISVLSSAHKNNLGHKKFIPLISVISLVLNLLAIASTNKKELVDNSA